MPRYRHNSNKPDARTPDKVCNLRKAINSASVKGHSHLSPEISSIESAKCRVIGRVNFDGRYGLYTHRQTITQNDIKDHDINQGWALPKECSHTQSICNQ